MQGQTVARAICQGWQIIPYGLPSAPCCVSALIQQCKELAAVGDGQRVVGA